MTPEPNQASNCFFFHFGLIVTGEAERDHLPQLFRSLMATGICSFEVIRYTGQRSPITSDKKKLKMVGSGRIIPDKDAEKIGFPARGYLSSSPCHFVIVIDDLEYDRRDIVQQVYERYRSTLDAILTEEQRGRASIHFLVNMLEAYYFADADSINRVLHLHPPLRDFEGDVEAIVHPKGNLKRIHKGFHEIDHGVKFLPLLTLIKCYQGPRHAPICVLCLPGV